MAITGEALFDVDDEKLKTIVRANARSVGFSQDDMLNELDRRASRRQAQPSFVLIVVSTSIALAALIVTALKS